MENQFPFFTRQELEKMLQTWQVELLEKLVESYYENLPPQQDGETLTNDDTKVLPQHLQKAAWSLVLPFLGRLAASALGGLAGRAIGSALLGRAGATVGARIGQVVGMLGGWDAVKRGLATLIGRESPERFLATIAASIPVVGQFVNFLRAVSPQSVQSFGEWLRDHILRHLPNLPPPAGAEEATPTPTTTAMAKALMGMAPPYYKLEEEAEIFMPLFAEFMRNSFIPHEEN